MTTSELPCRLPRIVAIGGVDPTGGAGLVRDFLTARSLGAAVRLVPTAWTEQSPTDGVRHIEPRPAAALMESIRDAVRVGPRNAAAAMAVKIGMLPDDATAAAVREGLQGFVGPVVLDPVLAASSGGALFAGDPEALVALAGRATVMTPNSQEAAILTGLPVRTLEEAAAVGVALRGRGVKAVLIKGGHLPPTTAPYLDGPAPSSVDLVADTLVDATGVRVFRSPRLSGPPVRGTGCALATAIAVGLARGLTLELAVIEARRWLVAALALPVAADGEWHLP